MLISNLPHARRGARGYADAALALISVLADVDALPQLYLNRPVLRRALTRYATRWLPLLAAQRPSARRALAPPLDVEWVWAVHMLCPIAYAADSRRLWATTPAAAEADGDAAFVVDHCLLAGPARAAANANAAGLWAAAYPGEPFDIASEIAALPVRDEGDAGEVPAAVSYDVVAAAARQMAFHYQVAVTPHYRHPAFLQAAVTRYCRFLSLGAENLASKLAPTYDIDLVWHAHMLHPARYVADTRRLRRGHTLPHDDSVNDRAPGSELLQVWALTKRLWKTRFDEHMPVAGGMFRGNLAADEVVRRAELAGYVPKAAPDCADGEGPHILRFDVDAEETEGFGEVFSAENECNDWVHRTGMSDADVHAEQTFVRNATVRLADAGKGGWSLRSTVMQTVVRNGGRVYEVRAFAEVRTAAHVAPLGTVHVAPPGSSVLTASGNKFRAFPAQGMTLVVRLGGRDVALLNGRWDGFRRPKRGVPGVPGDREEGRRGVPGKKGLPGRAGFLKLRVAHVGGATPGKWGKVVAHYKNSFREPPVYEITLPRGNGAATEERKGGWDVRIAMDDDAVEVRRGEDAVLGSLVGLGVSLLHVCLQPRCEEEEAPDGQEKAAVDGEKETAVDGQEKGPGGGEDTKESQEKQTMYPGWCVAQTEYQLLQAAGGERSGSDGHVFGHGRALRRAGVKGSALWTRSKAGNSHGAGPVVRGGIWALFGCQAAVALDFGFSFDGPGDGTSSWVGGGDADDCGGCGGGGGCGGCGGGGGGGDGGGGCGGCGGCGG